MSKKSSENISVLVDGERDPVVSMLWEKVSQFYNSQQAICFEQPLVWKILLIWAGGMGNCIRDKKKKLYESKQGDDPCVIQGILLSAWKLDGETDTLSGKKIEQQINTALLVAMTGLEYMIINGDVSSEQAAELREWFGKVLEWHFKRLGGAMTTVLVERDEKCQSIPMIFFDWRNDYPLASQYAKVRSDSNLGEAFVYPYQTQTLSPEQMKIVDYLVIAGVQKLVLDIRALLSKFPQAKIYYLNGYKTEQACDDKKGFETQSGIYVYCTTNDGGLTIVPEHHFMEMGIREKDLSAQNRFLAAFCAAGERGVRARLCTYTYRQRESEREFSRDAAIVEYSDE